MSSNSSIYYMTSYNKDQLSAIIQQCTSYRQVLIKLGLAPQGGNNETIKRKITEWNIDASHFTGQNHARGKKFQPRTNTEKYLLNDQRIGSFRLKNRLLEEGYFQWQCISCQQTKWLGNSIPLELDHIDGNSANNTLQNLRLLCPNCHALTPTYRGKNQKRAKSGRG